MTEQTSKRRFFIEGDEVCHIKTKAIYQVHGGYHSHKREVFIRYDETSEVEVCRGSSYSKFLFDELEMVEPYGEYMGNPTPDEMAIRADEPPPFKRLDHDAMFGCVPVPIAKNKAIPAPVKINIYEWVLFGDHSISSIYFIENSQSWRVLFVNQTGANIEPRYARAFLDSIGLTEDIEPRIGNQIRWDEYYPLSREPHCL